MCGNTIGQDRRFMARWMPRLEDFFQDVYKRQRQYIAGRLPIVNIDAAIEAIQATAHTDVYKRQVGTLQKIAPRARNVFHKLLVDNKGHRAGVGKAPMTVRVFCPAWNLIPGRRLVRHRDAALLGDFTEFKTHVTDVRGRVDVYKRQTYACCIEKSR